jgi:hypothetical protein
LLTMAKKRSGPSKSSAIREYVDANPTASPSEVAKALNDKGVSVTPQFVSTIKSQYKKKKAGGARRPGRPPGRRGRRGGRPPRAASSGITIEALIKAKALAEKLGGIDAAREALDALARLG